MSIGSKSSIIGTFAMNENKVLGVIMGVQTLNGAEVTHGVAMDGSLWLSAAPVMLGKPDPRMMLELFGDLLQQDMLAPSGSIKLPTMDQGSVKELMGMIESVFGNLYTPRKSPSAKDFHINEDAERRHRDRKDE